MSERKLNLFCVDGSEQCQNAFDWYCKTIHKETDIVGLTHIFQTPVAPIVPMALAGDSINFNTTLYDRLLKECYNESNRIVKKFKDQCTERTIKFEVFFQHIEDSIGNSICVIAHERKASTIVMGQRGLGLIRRTLIGSNSDYVVHHSRLPTIIVPMVTASK